jgi:hypothetical protein
MNKILVIFLMTMSFSNIFSVHQLFFGDEGDEIEEAPNSQELLEDEETYKQILYPRKKSHHRGHRKNGSSFLEHQDRITTKINTMHRNKARDHKDHVSGNCTNLPRSVQVSYLHQVTKK